MPHLLNIDNFSCWFTSGENGSEQQILENISFAIEAGEIVALAGESGSGKTITALSLLRLAEEISLTRTEGSIRFEGRDIAGLSQKELQKLRGGQIAMIFQEPSTALNPLYSIGDQISESILLHSSLTRDEARAEAIRLLEKTGINDAAKRFTSFPHQLSGGQRQRAMIAMAISGNPRLLIADEPTTALDVTIQQQILALLRELREEMGLAILLITHDLPLVRSFSDQVHIMKDGKIVESGQPEHLFRNPRNPYTRKLLTAVLKTRISPPQRQENLLSVKELTCVFPRRMKRHRLLFPGKELFYAVNSVSFSVPRGTTCGIIGESGSGKSTLAMALLRLLKSSGTISYNATNIQNIRGEKLRTLRRKMQVVFQDPYSSLSPRMRLTDIISEGLTVHFPALTKEQRDERVIATMKEVGLDPETRHRFPHEFSGGQRQRIAIARAIILQPELLILDEPTSALDMTVQQQILTLLLELQKKFAMTYIFISHDLRVIRSLSHQILVMHNGQIIEAGNAEAVFSAPKMEYTKKLFEAALQPL